MRPVRLTMQAFGPYPGRTVIDFRDAIAAGLFGIYGQTGSGKSTIFSAMTFALFGAPAKPDQDARTLRSDHADAGILTEVEFVFEIGARRFVIFRRPEQTRPKQRGGGETRSLHEAFLFDATELPVDEITDAQRGKIIAEKKVGTVDTAVCDLLGYGAEQFRQIVLLPQGRFEMFLAAKTNERLAILRDLFDVSLYRTLAAKLKTDADAAESHVSRAREVCAARLAAEGFESTDALIGGIAEAAARQIATLKHEKEACEIFEAAQTALRKAEMIEFEFKAAEEAVRTLAALEACNGEMDALAERARRAERARSLLDAEAGVASATREVSTAEEKLREAQAAAAEADANARFATEALIKETSRAGELEDLRREVDALGRHKQALEKSTGLSEALERALATENEAGRKFNDAQSSLATLHAQRREKSDALKSNRQTESRRQEITAHITSLRLTRETARTFEKARQDVLHAEAAVEQLRSEHTAVQSEAGELHARYEEAERNHSTAQALHLATKLEAGEPCPVCGATDHPAPATRAIEHVESDQAFRAAKSAWQKADDAARKIEQKLFGAQSVLDERRVRLAALDRTEENATALDARVRNEQKALDDLSLQTDIARAEAEIERMGSEIETLEKERDALREFHSECQQQTSAESVRLEAMLAAVPELLRDPDALAAAIDTVSQNLTQRQTAKATAERTATETREAALAATKDRDAIDTALSGCRERHAAAVEFFNSRLAQAALSGGDFQALKPAIATLDEDRATVEQHQRALGIAKANSDKAADAIRDKLRPDLESRLAKQREASKEFTAATDRRSGASHHLQQLTKLRDELAGTLRQLDEAEAASGPLRNLAALVNGDNAQKLALETFAIGAMFDQVLEAANLRMAPMTSNRYQLERDMEAGRGRRGLGIQVFDVFTGKSRSTATLSGGETFIAALSLALGLADVVESASGKISLDTIFIDEGFGSLDTENGSGTLDQVLHVLSSLVSKNRAVGIISHVPLVQEAIPNGFYVRKDIAGSTVETREAN